MERMRVDGNTAGKDAFAKFESFYDFAFPRVYRFAKRRMDREEDAEALCRLILVSALTSLGGLDERNIRSHRDPAGHALWLYRVSRRVAESVERHPELLVRARAELDDAGLQRRLRDHFPGLSGYVVMRKVDAARVAESTANAS